MMKQGTKSQNEKTEVGTMESVIKLFKASEVKVGYRVVEMDGAEFVVIDVHQVGRKVYLTLDNLNGYLGTPSTVKATLKSNAMVRVGLYAVEG